MTTKRVPILPTLVTLGNAFCGFMAIDYAIRAPPPILPGSITGSAGRAG